jgi:hypothetical protein
MQEAWNPSENVSHYEVRVPGEPMMTQVTSLHAGVEAAQKYNAGLKEKGDRACVFARYVSGSLSTALPRSDPKKKDKEG